MPAKVKAPFIREGLLRIELRAGIWEAYFEEGWLGDIWSE
jgi:hypothetical protein